MSSTTTYTLKRKIALFEKNVFMKLNEIQSGIEAGQSFNKLATEIHDCLYWHEKRLFAIHELQVRESHVIDG